MRKYQQKRIFELLNTLTEAHTELRKLNSPELRVGLLADCQAFAVRIGRYIEDIAGQGMQSVALLEEYCELLYHASAGVAANIKTKNLDKQISKIRSMVESELKPDRFEMVFLPYKASMWDAMESVWLAAREDPQCNAIVMPIPYFDRSPNGKFTDMHDESGLYPQDVPIVDWREYDLAEQQPDVIVIHNPYDDRNIVTSVHPDFYSDKLKKCTDLLVYIPYFVVPDTLPPHFAYAPGVINADCVFVQSEEVRGNYIEEYRKIRKSGGANNKSDKAEDKFVALGSPKFDKVMNSKPEDDSLPQGWEKLIRRADGKRKKVVLYNTSISAMLTESEHYLEKLRFVLESFQDRSDVVLWWRPHPLGKATYDSMRPELLREYQRIVQEYKTSGYGIYDDTPELHRAIAESDAYYGDYSSLVALYSVTGKPIMVQNVDIYANTTPHLFYPADFALYGSKLIGIDFKTGVLLQIDKYTMEMEYLTSLADKYSHLAGMYASAADDGDCLYFTPRSTDKIAKYNMQSGKLNVVTLKNDYSKAMINTGLFRFSLQFGQYIFFVGYAYPAILRYNVCDDETVYYTDWIEKARRFLSPAANQAQLYFGSPCAMGSKMATPLFDGNALLIFDMESCKSEVYEVGDKGCKYAGAAYDGQFVWLIPRNGCPIIRWEYETLEWKAFGAYPPGYNPGEFQSFLKGQIMDGSLWLIPYQANMALKLDLKSGNIMIAEELQSECESATAYPGDNPNYASAIADGETLYAYGRKSGEMVALNCIKGELSRKQLSLLRTKEPDQIDKIIKSVLNLIETGHCVLNENIIVRIETLLDALVRRAELEADNSKLCADSICYSGNAGQDIYAYCKKMLGDFGSGRKGI